VKAASDGVGEKLFAQLVLPLVQVPQMTSFGFRFVLQRARMDSAMPSAKLEGTELGLGIARHQHFELPGAHDADGENAEQQQKNQGDREHRTALACGAGCAALTHSANAPCDGARERPVDRLVLRSTYRLVPTHDKILHRLVAYSKVVKTWLLRGTVVVNTRR